jgi:hypothetical protein
MVIWRRPCTASSLQALSTPLALMMFVFCIAFSMVWSKLLRPGTSVMRYRPDLPRGSR